MDLNDLYSKQLDRLKHLNNGCQIYRKDKLHQQHPASACLYWINKKNDFNVVHTHPNSFLSAAYYVKAPENSGDLVCNEPRAGAQLNMPVRKEGRPPKHLWREVHLKPVEGRIIIFPYYLWHNVTPNESNDIRISVSFNFIQHGF